MSTVASAPSIIAAAAMLAEARLSHRACPRVSDAFGIEGVDQAYAVQDINTNTSRAIDQGRRLVGRRIGLTSKAVQQQLDVNELPPIPRWEEKAQVAYVSP